VHRADPSKQSGHTFIALKSIRICRSLADNIARLRFCLGYLFAYA
jgi:hypothetical protein